MTTEKSKIFIYHPKSQSVLYKSLDRVVQTLFDNEKVHIGSEFNNENIKDYGLIIDTSGLLESQEGSNVYRDLRKLDLEKMPNVEYVDNPLTTVVEIARYVRDFTTNKGGK